MLAAAAEVRAEADRYAEDVLAELDTEIAHARRRAWQTLAAELDAVRALHARAMQELVAGAEARATAALAVHNETMAHERAELEAHAAAILVKASAEFHERVSAADRIATEIKAAAQAEATRILAAAVASTPPALIPPPPPPVGQAPPPAVLAVVASRRGPLSRLFRRRLVA